jgi:hypothetical protein
MIASQILIQADAGPAAIVTAPLGNVPGVPGNASAARPPQRRCAGGDARYPGAGQAGDVPRQGPGGGTRTMSCPVIHR